MGHIVRVGQQSVPFALKAINVLLTQLIQSLAQMVLLLQRIVSFVIPVLLVHIVHPRSFLIISLVRMGLIRL